MDVSVEKQFKEKKSRIFLYSGIVLFLTILLVTFGYLNIAKAATSPSIITYQGKLLNNGVAVTTTQDIKYILYDDPTAGTALYSAAGTTSSPSAVSTTVSDGFFTIDLGDTGTNSIDPAIFKNNSAVYLKVIVGLETLSPRKRITASPYSLNSKYLDGVGATSTPQASAYIPVSDSSGNFNFYNVTSTGLIVTGNTTLSTTTISSSTIGNLNATNAIFVNSTSTGSFWTNLLTAATGWFTDLFWGNATSTGSTYLNTLTTIGNTSLATTTISSSTIGNLNVTNNEYIGGLLSVTGNATFNTTTFNGYVGIGTSSPQTKLHVYDGTLLVDGPVSSTVLSTLAGDSRDVYVTGNYAYTADGFSGVKIIDITKPSSPSLIGTYNTAGEALGIFVSGNYAYVADSLAGLAIVDISNSSAPFLSGTVNTPGDALGIYVSGKYAYVADSTGGLQIIDVSNPTTPSIVGNVAAIQAQKVFVAGKYAYVAGGSLGLHVMDISNPTSPIQVGILDTTGFSYDVYVSGKYAFVADHTSGLHSIDISNPASPSLVGTMSALSNVRGVFVAGKYAYLAIGGTGLGIVDISDPVSPTFVSTVSAGAAYNVFVSGKYAYLASGAPGLYIIDIKGANISAANIGNITTNNLTISENVDVGNNLYIRNGLNIGQGGMFSNGSVAIIVTSTFSTNTIFSAGTNSTSSVFSVNSEGATISGLLSVTGNSTFNTITSGTWNGSNIGNSYGGTGQNSSGWTGFSRVSSGVWSVTSSVSLNTDISGVLGIVNGGTGTSTFNNGGVVFSDGTQLLQDTSNFFWDNTNNRLGIGTSTPSEKLQVNGGNILQNAFGDLLVKGSVGTTNALSVYVSGKYAYVADNTSGLRIIDVSNQSSPELVGTYATTNAQGVYVSGRYAYVADYTAGLRVVDISNPTLPSLVGTYDTGIARSVYVSGKYAYVSDVTSGLVIVDISNPTSPSLVGSYSLSGGGGDLYVSGKYVYIGDGTSLRIIDISNPSTPILVGTSVTTNAQGVYVSGKYAYVADSSSGLRIINASNPSSPTTVGTLAITDARKVFVSGRYAYVVDYNGGIKVVDIYNSASPTLIGSLVSGTTNGVFVSGKYAYVADGAAGLKVLDINGMETPALNAGNIFTNNLTVSENVDIGNNLSIRNSLNIGMGGLYSNGSVAITVSTTISTTTLFSIGTSTQNILSVMGNGYIGIGTSSPSEKLQINGGNILHTAYGNPTVVGSLGTPTVRGVYVSGKYAYGAGDSGGLRIFDVSSPAAPVLIGTASIGTAYEVAVSGKFAYVVGGASGLKIVDVSNPTSPVLVGAVSTTNAGTVFISGKYAYIADGTSGLRIIDISNPTSPSIVGSVTTTNAIGVYVSGKYAYVADFAGGLKIINVSNPASPTTTGSYSMSLAFRVYVSGKYAYVADENNGLKIINISNPSSPSLTGSVTLAGAYSVFVSGKYAYMGDYTSGFKIIDINGIDTPTMSVGNISTNDLTVSENVDVGNNLYIRNGLNIGLGGLLSNGAVAITVSTTISTSTLFSVGTSTANIFTIMGDGKIGIGTSTPSTTLSVVGNVGITNGALYINNNNYSQYFVNSPGTFGQLWQSNGVTGTWANTNGVVGQTLAYNANGWESSSALLTSSTTYSFEGNVNPPASFVASGPSTNWTATTTGVYAGSKSLQSPPTADSSSSTLTNIVYLSNTTTISFWWKVSSEASRDYLIFCLDRPICYADNAGYLLNNNVSTTDANITGAVAWTQVTSTVSAGLHTLRWIYLKDPNTITGSDAGFLDDIFIGKNDDVQIQNNLTVSTQMLIGTSTFGTTGYKLTIDSGSSSGAGVGVNGYIKATGFITGTTTLDLAETYPINMLCAANGTCPTDGDVVCSDTTVIAGVKKCLGTDGDQMIGIVSANPGFLLGGGDFSNPTNIGGSVKVALAGRVPVKVSTENGVINAGDKLTLSNIDGVAAKAIGEAPVVGVAMDSYSGSEIGSIVVFVNLGWQNQLYKALTIDTNTSTLTVGSNITPYNLALSGEFTMFNDILNKLVFNATALFESKTNGTHAFIFNAVNFADSTDKYLLSLRSNDEPKFSVMSNGDLRASGNIYAASAVFGTSTNPGDLAERVDIASDDIVEPGDVLVIDMNNTDTYRRSSGSNEQAVAGVVSTNPTIVVGNGKTEYTAVMAMVGRVPLKVSDENGSISRGDLLVTASSSGYAMKYDPKKDNDDKMIGVVGVALDPFNNGKGKIMALVRTGWVNSKYETISSIKENIQQLATAQGIVLGATSTANLSVVSNNNQLSYSGGDLNLQGNNLLNVASIVGKNNRWLIDDSGHFITKINTSQGEKDMYAIQSPTSEFVFSSSSQLMAGEAKIIFDQTMQDVIDSSQPLKINITLTSGEAKGIFVSEKNSQGFTVKELDNGVSGATFDWMVVAKRKEQSDVIPSVENTIEINTTDITTTSSVVDITTTTIESVTNDESITLVSSSTPEVPVIPVNPIIDSEVITLPVETSVEVSTPVPSAEAPTPQ